MNIELISRLDEALQSSGLVARGVFTDQNLAPFQSGVLIGHLGGGFWLNFQKWYLENPKTLNPLNAWSKIVIDAVARNVGGKAVYPSDKPYLPFQRWAKQAEGLKASPLGLLMHPKAGLWHAYRGAILFEQMFNYENHSLKEHPCDSCHTKPCQTNCPVDAVKPDRFDFEGCLSHLATPKGQTCMAGGCIARNACPIGFEYRYSKEQLAFHQMAFYKNNQNPSK